VGAFEWDNNSVGRRDGLKHWERVCLAPLGYGTSPIVVGNHPQARSTVPKPKSLPIERPPIRGKMTVVVDSAPVSFQAKPERRNELADVIQASIGPVEYLLTGDVKLSIKWYQPVKTRYESDNSPDLDNILKPIMDALSGPDGIMVDDCQVQALRCKWIDRRVKDEKVTIKLEYNPDHWLRKEGIRFIHIGNGLCFPYPARTPREALGMIIVSMQSSLEAKNIILEHRFDYRRAQLIMPKHRFFHRTRLSRFEVLEVSELGI
jgi:Holliday junction resolvase RusA-like endonuclease